MQRMTEEEFDQLKATTPEGQPCEHEVVKLCAEGGVVDYGCIKCKIKCADERFLPHK